MKKKLMVLAVLMMSLAAQAQEKVLQKYSKLGDVNTVYVSGSMMSQMPLDQLGVPGMANLVSRLESMKVLISRGDKAGKQMGTKLPKQLTANGFELVLNTKKDGHTILVLQSKEDPSSVVTVIYNKPHATVVSMKGDFSDGLPEEWLKD